MFVLEFNNKYINIRSIIGLALQLVIINDGGMYQVTSSSCRFGCCCWSMFVYYLLACSTFLFRNRSQKSRL